VSYRIEIRREALHELKGLPAHVRAEALQRIDALEKDPRRRVPSSCATGRVSSGYGLLLIGGWSMK